MAESQSVSDRRFLLAVPSVSHEKIEISRNFLNFKESGKDYGKDFENFLSHFERKKSF